MSKEEAPLHSLSDFLPKGSYPLVEPYILHYKVHLTVKRARASVLGDYRNAHPGKAHRITVNGNLNPYAFLVTLLHELAHLVTFVRFGHRVASHGKEWQDQFAELIRLFLQASLFPEDISRQLQLSMQRRAASSCADDALMRVLRKYDPVRQGFCLVEELLPGELFLIKGGRIFTCQEKVRKRIKALEMSTGKVYLFSPVYEVKRHS